MQRTSVARYRWSLVLLAVAAGYWSFYLRTLAHGVSYGDEGLVAQGALRIVRGEVPYRDFLLGVTPGGFYWSALFLKVFGPTFAALRWSALVTAMLNLGLLLWILARFRPSTLLPVLAVASYCWYFIGPYWFIPSYHWLSLACCLGSLALLLENDGERFSPWLTAGAGVLAALAAFTLQHKGVLWMLAATLGLCFLARGRRGPALRWFWGGVVAAALPMVVVFVSLAGWQTMIQNLIVFPLTRYHLAEAHQGVVMRYLAESWNGMRTAWPYHETFLDWVRIVARFLGFSGHLLVHLLPLLALAAWCDLWRRQGLSRYHLVVLGAGGAALYLSALHRLADTTLGFAAPVAVLILVLWYETRAGEGRAAWPRRAAQGWVGLFGAIAGAFLLLKILSPVSTTMTPAGPVDSAYVGEAQTLDGVTAYLAEHRRPGEPIFCYSYLAMFYFLQQAPNPTPFDLLVAPLNTEQEFEQARRLLDEKQCRWVLWDYTSHDTTPFGRYLAANFEIKAQFKYVAVLERKVSSAPAPGERP